MIYRRTILLALIAAASLGSAQADDLVLDPRTGQLIVLASPNLSGPGANNKQLTSNAPTPPLLAIYTDDGQVSNSCALQTGWKLQLMNGGTAYLEVVVGPAQLTTNALQGTFGSTTAPNGYVAFSLNNYTPGMKFGVTDGTTAQCNGVTGTLTQTQYLRISSDASPGPQLHSTEFGDSDGPPIPIVGNSLQFQAPAGSTLTCTDLTHATIDGLEPVLGLDRPQYAPSKAEPVLALQGVNGWTITAYPQIVEITRGWWSGKLNFSIAPPLRFKCGNLNSIMTLDVVDAQNNVLKTRPQEFVVTWPTGWVSRQTMSLPCATCRLRLITRKKASNK
jgi:hypothetical protein